MFVVTLEVATRVEDAVVWGAPMLGPYSHARLVLSDSLGFRNRPGYRFEKWSINSLGFRGPEIDSVPTSVRLRVGVLGASETFGLFEREDWDYPSRLRSVVDSLGPGGIEIVNLGVAGMGLPAMADYYERVVKTIAPDLVFIYPSPSFYLDIDPPEKSGEPRTALGPGINTGSPSRVALTFPELRLRWRVRNALRQFLPPQLQEAFHRRSINRVRGVRDPDWVWETVPADRMRLFKSHLEELVAVIQGDGAEVVLVTHVNRFLKSQEALTSEDWRHMTAVLSYFPRATPGVMIEVDVAANQVIRDVARDRNVGLIDLEGRIPPSADYFADYAHFTDAGADMMGRILAGAVISVAKESLQP